MCCMNTCLEKSLYIGTQEYYDYLQMVLLPEAHTYTHNFIYLFDFYLFK